MGIVQIPAARERERLTGLIFTVNHYVLSNPSAIKPVFEVHLKDYVD